MIVMLKIKRIFLPIMFLSAGLALAQVFAAEAEPREALRHIPIDKVLEFTLEQLQDSLQAVSRQNEQLAFENALFRRNIQKLNLNMDSTAALDPMPVRGLPADEGLEAMGGRDVDFKLRGQRTDELIAYFEWEIALLNEKIRILDHKLDKGAFGARMKELSRQKDFSIQNMARAEKRYKELEASNRDFLQALSRLKAENEVLEQELMGLLAGH